MSVNQFLDNSVEDNSEDVGQGPSTKISDHANGSGKRKIENRNATSYPRKRASQACLVCRSRKSRCDNERPVCGFCRSNGTQCTYPGVELSRIDPASLLILDRVTRMESRLSDKLSDLARTCATRLGSGPNQMPVTPSYISAPSPAATGPHVARYAINGDTIMTWPLIQKLLGRMEDTAKWSMSIEDNVPRPVLSPSIVREITSASASEYPRVYDGPLQELQDTEYTTTHRNSEREWGLIESYFTHVHSKSPIFDPEWLYDFHRDVTNAGWRPSYFAGPMSASGLCPTTLCTYLLVLALGHLTDDERSCSPGTPLRPSRYFDYALSWMGPSSCYGNRDTYTRMGFHDDERVIRRWIERTQCLLLKGTYFMWTMRPWDARIAFGEAEVLAKSFMHVGSLSSEIPEEVADLKFRVCWATAKAESEVHEEVMGLLPREDSMLRLGYFDTLPKPPAAQSQQESRNRSMGSRSWFYYLAEVASRKILDRISEELHLAKGDSSLSITQLAGLYPVAKELEAQIREWSASLPRNIFSSGADGASTSFSVTSPSKTSNISRELLQHLQNREFHARIATFRPFLQAIALNQTFEQEEWAAAMSPSKTHSDYMTVLDGAFRCVVVCVEFLEAQREPHRHFGSWRCGRAMWAAALSLLAAAMIPDLKRLMKAGQPITNSPKAAAQTSPGSTASLLSRAESALRGAATWLYRWKDESPSLLLGARTLFEGIDRAHAIGLFR